MRGIAMLVRTDILAKIGEIRGIAASACVSAGRTRRTPTRWPQPPDSRQGPPLTTCAAAYDSDDTKRTRKSLNENVLTGGWRHSELKKVIGRSPARAT